MARSDDYLRELGLELVVDVLEGAAEVGELLAGLLGDKHLGQAVPVDRLAGLRRRVGHLLHHPVPAHLARLPSPRTAAAADPRSPWRQNGNSL